MVRADSVQKYILNPFRLRFRLIDRDEFQPSPRQRLRRDIPTTTGDPDHYRKYTNFFGGHPLYMPSETFQSGRDCVFVLYFVVLSMSNGLDVYVCNRHTGRPAANSWIRSSAVYY